MIRGLMINDSRVGNQLNVLRGVGAGSRLNLSAEKLSPLVPWMDIERERKFQWWNEQLFWNERKFQW